MRTETKKPSGCSSTEIKAFEGMVKKAGEVQVSGLHARIMAAERLIFIYTDSGEIAGVAAVKRPGEVYKRRVFRKANSPEDPASYPYEIGWVVVGEAYRGRRLSRVLLEAALKGAPAAKIYATTRTDNEPMRRTNERFGFRVSGEPYPTTREGENYHLSLFVRE